MDGLHILVVDDTPQIRMLLRLNLELEGARVTEAADGSQCLEVLEDLQRRGEPLPDAVTIDAVMEPLDGWSTVAAIRARPATVGLAVVMVTASVQAHHEQRAAAVGVDAFVPKPFDPLGLVDVVRAAVASRRQPPSPSA